MRKYSTSVYNGNWHLKQDYSDHLLYLNNDLVPSLLIIHELQCRKIQLVLCAKVNNLQILFYHGMNFVINNSK